MKKVILSTLISVFMTASAFAYVGDAYVTPNTWSKHINANGVTASSGGLDYGDSGILKIGATTRAQLRFSENMDWSLYEYLRLRLTGAKAANGDIDLNLNVRVAYDQIPNRTENSIWRDGIYTSRGVNTFDWRIYQANLGLNKLIPLTDIDLGRIYLSTFDNYKIDGFNIAVDPVDLFKMNVYYGLPVSNYSNLHTQVVGAAFEVPVDSTGTKVRAEYSYFIHSDGGDKNTHVARARLDQSLSFADILNATLHLEAALIGKAVLYEAGFDTNIDKSKTGLSAYIAGQALKNDKEINPYVSMYEGMFGSSEYVMGGFQVTQGITDYLMLGLGYEGRFNFTEAYGDRDYHRVFANVDLIGLIHRNNFLSLIVDYYDVAAYGRLNGNQKVLGGLRMTQIFNDKVESWLGVNVQNFQYRNNPIKSIGGFLTDGQVEKNQNTTVAYIGTQYKVTEWCVLQLDYTFEYADLFKDTSLQPDVHTVEMWVNFIW